MQLVYYQYTSYWMLINLWKTSVLIEHISFKFRAVRKVIIYLPAESFTVRMDISSFPVVNNFLLFPISRNNSSIFQRTFLMVSWYYTSPISFKKFRLNNVLTLKCSQIFFIMSELYNICVAEIKSNQFHWKY